MMRTCLFLVFGALHVCGCGFDQEKSTHHQVPMFLSLTEAAPELVFDQGRSQVESRLSLASNAIEERRFLFRADKAGTLLIVSEQFSYGTCDPRRTSQQVSLLRLDQSGVVTGLHQWGKDLPLRLGAGHYLFRLTVSSQSSCADLQAAFGLRYFVSLSQNSPQVGLPGLDTLPNRPPALPGGGADPVAEEPATPTPNPGVTEPPLGEFGVIRLVSLTREGCTVREFFDVASSMAKYGVTNLEERQFEIVSVGEASLLKFRAGVEAPGYNIAWIRFADALTAGQALAVLEDTRDLTVSSDPDCVKDEVLPIESSDDLLLF